MKKVIAIAALLALAACAKKEAPASGADTTTAAHDSTMARDTANQM
jgi:predicted outer membrane protein